MSTLLAVMTYKGGNDTLNRHLPYFQRQEADWLYIISTDNDQSDPPPNAHKRIVGRDSYINGSHLPQRMIDTIKELLKVPWKILILCEYDCLFLNRIRVEAMEHAIASHYAGGATWGSKANKFYHNPWVFHREAAMKFVQVGQKEIDDGICGNNEYAPHPPEASPDVFFGYVTEKYQMPVQSDLWQEYSRNSLDVGNHLEEARQAYQKGVNVIHGCKEARELEYILS